MPLRCLDTHLSSHPGRRAAQSYIVSICLQSAVTNLCLISYNSRHDLGEHNQAGEALIQPCLCEDHL